MGSVGVANAASTTLTRHRRRAHRHTLQRTAGHVRSLECASGGPLSIAAADRLIVCSHEVQPSWAFREDSTLSGYELDVNNDVDVHT